MADQTLGVIVPTIGDRPEIRRLLESVANQVRRPDRICVVVDADDPAFVESVLEGLSAQMDGIDVDVVVTGARRRAGEYLAETGYGVAVNRGLKAVETDLIALLDDDDEILPEHFSNLTAALANTPEARAAYTRATVVSVDGTRRSFQKGLLPRGWVDPFVVMTAHPVLLPTMVVERSLYEELDGMDESFDRKADTDMLVRIAKATPLAAVDEATYLYYRYPHGSEVRARAHEETAELIEKHQSGMTRRQRFVLWDSLARAASDAGHDGVAVKAAREAMRNALGSWGQPLAVPYLRVRGSKGLRRVASQVSRSLRRRRG